MRLLNTRTWEMRVFLSGRPDYAILSHTWTDDEVTLQDWQATIKEGLDIASIPRFKKIYEFALCARGELGQVNDTFEWIWVDTCCIDKTSSAELSEAINSMFKWYAESRICYAYLSDVSPAELGLFPLQYQPEIGHRPSTRNADLPRLATEFVRSRWFTRGWTLQELIAPTTVLFVCNDWTPIGYKGDAAINQAIQQRTGIRPVVLGGRSDDVSRYSIAERMAWASDRITSREEDLAYALMGIFLINMPLLYGEGKVKAFHRLQEAIMKQSQDQSLFAWGTRVEVPSIYDGSPDRLAGELPPRLPWREDASSQQQYGLLADSPAAFADFKQFRDGDSDDFEEHPYAHELHRIGPPRIVNGGVLLNIVVAGELPCVRYWNNPNFAWSDKMELAVLMCTIRGAPLLEGRLYFTIHLLAQGNGYYTRTKEVFMIEELTRDRTFPPSLQRHIKVTNSPFMLEPRDIFFRTFDTDLVGYSTDLVGYSIWSTSPSNIPHRVLLWRDKVLRFRSRSEKYIEIRYPVPGTACSIALFFEEVFDTELGRHLLRVGIISYDKPVDKSPNRTVDAIDIQTYTMVDVRESWEAEPVLGLRLRVNYELIGNGLESEKPLVDRMVHYWLLDLAIKHEHQGQSPPRLLIETEAQVPDHESRARNARRKLRQQASNERSR